jgi:hypothetical protein
MATHTLVEGAVDLNASASYNAGAGPAPSGWASGDNLLILDGSQTINVNLSALSALTLTNVLIGPNFKGQIGDIGTSMVLGTVTMLQIAGGGGDIYISPGTCALAEVKDTRGGLVAVTGGTCADFVSYLGRVRVTTAAIITACRNLGAVLDIGYNATGITTLHQRRGKTIIDRAVTNGKMLDGLVEAMKNCSIGTALDQFGGVWDHRGGGVAGFTGFGGTFNAANARNDFAFTGTLTRYKGFKMIDKSGAATVTLPAAANIKDYGYGQEAVSALAGYGGAV